MATVGICSRYVLWTPVCCQIDLRIAYSMYCVLVHCNICVCMCECACVCMCVRVCVCIHVCMPNFCVPVVQAKRPCYVRANLETHRQNDAQNAVHIAVEKKGCMHLT